MMCEACVKTDYKFFSFKASFDSISFLVSYELPQVHSRGWHIYWLDRDDSYWGHRDYGRAIPTICGHSSTIGTLITKDIKSIESSLKIYDSMYCFKCAEMWAAISKEINLT